MPRTTKPKTNSTPLEAKSLMLNGPPGEVFTLEETAAYLKLPEAAVISAIHAQGLPGRFIGGEWRFLKTAIQHWLSTGSPTPESRKAAQLAAAGKSKGDSELEQIVENAMRNRGRRPMADGTFSGCNP